MTNLTQTKALPPLVIDEDDPTTITTAPEEDNQGHSEPDGDESLGGVVNLGQISFTITDSGHVESQSHNQDSAAIVAMAVGDVRQAVSQACDLLGCSADDIMQAAYDNDLLIPCLRRSNNVPKIGEGMSFAMLAGLVKVSKAKARRAIKACAANLRSQN